MRRCSNCGTRLYDNKYCPECGFNRPDESERQYKMYPESFTKGSKTHSMVKVEILEVNGSMTKIRYPHGAVTWVYSQMLEDTENE